MLAEQRRGPADGRQRAVEAQRRADHADRAGRGVRHRAHEAQRLRLRALQRLAHRLHRGHGHIRRLQQRAPRGDRLRGERGVERGDQRRPVGQPGGIGREARVGRPAGVAQRRCQGGELPVVADRHGQPAVGGGEQLIGHDVGVGVAVARGVVPGHEHVLADVDQRGQRRLEQRDLHVRAARRGAALARQQGGLDRVRRVQAGQQVDDGHAQLHRRAVGLPRDAHQAPRRLHGEVVARPRSQGAHRPVARDAAVDERRIEGVQRVVVDAPGGGSALAVVLDQDVGAGRQAVQGGPALRLLQVEHQASLVAVDRQVVGGLAAGKRRAPGAGLVAVRLLDLDHVGAQVGEEHCGEGAREHAGAIEHAHAGQGGGRGRGGRGHQGRMCQSGGRR